MRRAQDYTVTISADDGVNAAVTERFTITVTEPAAPAVTVTDASADEGDSLTFTVTLDKAVSGGFTVTPSFTDATAAEGTDYTENTDALSFAGTKGEQHSFTVETPRTRWWRPARRLPSAWPSREQRRS